MTKIRADIARLMHSNAQVPRSALFGEAEERYAPVQYPEDAKTMFAGYMGPEYVSGGAVFFGINPGGGASRRHPDDDTLYPLLRAFRDTKRQPPIREFEAVNDAFRKIVKNWNLWRIFHRTLQAFGYDLTRICYLNTVPYRTRENKMPPVAAQRTSWETLIKPTLCELDPEVLVPLGKAAGGIVERFDGSRRKIYVVPRTRGDTYISPEAKNVLAKIRRDYGT